MRNSTTVKIALVIASIATFVPAARAADIGKTTTWQVAKFAMVANHAHGFHLVGGASAVYCDSYRTALPTKIICQMHTNVASGRCITTINMAANGHAVGQVACGNGWRTLPKSVKPWGFSVRYSWDGVAYKWSQRYEFGIPA